MTAVNKGSATVTSAMDTQKLRQKVGESPWWLTRPLEACDIKLRS